jgi:predicted GH43/DUF377 family glycosyl hydrolase
MRIAMNYAKWLAAIVVGLCLSLVVVSATGWNFPVAAMNKPQDSASKINLPGTVEAANSASARDSDWKRLGVVLDLGSRGSYDDKSIESPLILKLGEGSYVMFYRGQTYADKVGRIMRATSSDGITWTKTGVVMTPSESYEGNKIDPMAVMFDQDVYKMWYGSDTSGGCACYATSPDGINWTRSQDNPVLRKTHGSWDNEGAGGQNTVIKSGDMYYMYYKGYGKAAPGWTFYGLAASSDGVNWSKQGKVISPDPSMGETTFFKNLYAFKVGGYYCILHTMADYLSLFLCTSQDGKTWTKDGLLFSHGLAPGGYDIKWATSPCLIVDGNTVRMWYEGGDSSGRVRTLYAEIDKSTLIKDIQ